ARATADDLAAAWAAASVTLREAEAAATRSALAQQAFDVAAERLQTREALIADLADRRRRVEELQEECERLAVEAGPHEAALAEAEQSVESARKAALAARRDAAAAESDAALVSDLDDLLALLSRLDRLDAARAAQQVAREHERAVRFTGDLTAIDEAAREVDLARAAWRAGSATVEVTPHTPDLDVTIDGQALTLSRAHTDVLSGPVEIDMPGTATVRFTPPPGGQERAEMLARAEAALAELLGMAGVDDVAAARAAAQRQEEARTESREHDRAVEAVLAGDTDHEVRDRAARLHAHVVELLADRTGLDEAPAAVRALLGADEGADNGDRPAHREGTEANARDIAEGVGDRGGAGGIARVDPGVVREVLAWVDSSRESTSPREERAAARRREDEAAEALARGEAEVLAARRVVEDGRLAEARAEVARESARAEIEELATRVRVARERHSDDELASARHTAHADLAAATQAADEVRAEVARLDPDSLEVRLAGATAAVESLQSRHAAARDERLALEARLRHAGEQGRAERLAEAESALARAERLHVATTRRAAAAKELYDTLRRHRDRVSAAYVEPFGQVVSTLGRVVYGPDFDVEVGPGLTIDARVLAGRRIPYEALSSGAKEQMSILTRLACASLVDPEQGAPVIIDDALGYSDPAKLQRICSAFSLVGGTSQIILLTCTPGRYGAIPGATVVQV
ncbi:MAG: hypothetical protein Q4G43_16550, partial [Mobilicoccus sp.]|nr:hypothetical protein [Mobilicoccus sp.]